MTEVPEKKPNAFMMVAVQPYLEFFKFGGRVGRSTFWLHMVMAYVFSYAISTIAMPMFFDMKAFEEAAVTADTDPALFFDVMAQFAKAIVPITLLSSISFIALPSMLIRRMHDTGKSGWWAAPYLALGAVGIYASITYAPKMIDATMGKDTETLKAMAVPLLVFAGFTFITMIVTIILAAQKSQPHPNDYGVQPPAAIG